jgi:hypothetical protein
MMGDHSQWGYDDQSYDFFQLGFMSVRPTVSLMRLIGLPRASGTITLGC